MVGQRNVESSLSSLNGPPLPGKPRVALVLALIVLLAAGILFAQRELQAVVGCFQARILQGALQPGGITAQHVERFGALHDQARGHVAVLIDIEAHVDATQFRRIETDFEAVAAISRARDDFGGKAADRDRLSAGLPPRLAGR